MSFVSVVNVIETQINLQLTGKISLDFDFSSSSLL